MHSKMNNNNNRTSTSKKEKEKLVVEVIAAHNLMPKDGEGSSSPFVEVVFESQRLRTQVKYKDLNPIWNEKLIFSVNDVADLPYHAIEANVFNEKRTSNSRNFLGKVRISGSYVAKEDEEQVPQLYPLDKRSLFSNVRGEISLKLYMSSRVEQTKKMTTQSQMVGSGSGSKKKNKKQGQQQQQQMSSASLQQQQQMQHEHQQRQLMQQQQLQIQQQQQQQMLSMMQDNNNKQENHHHHYHNHFHPYQPHRHYRPPNQGQHRKSGDQTHSISGGGGEIMIKPVNVLTTIPNPNTTLPVGTSAAAVNGYSSTRPSNDFSLKETSPRLGGDPHNKDKTSLTYDLVEQMQYLYVRVVKAKDLPLFNLGLGGGTKLSAEVKVGNYKGITNRVGYSNVNNNNNTTTTTWEWDQVFAFSKDCIGSSMVEIFVKEDDNHNHNQSSFLGRVWFDLNEIPRRVPPDSQLAPQWYRMEDKKGDKSNGGEVMVSVWFGTQSDEAFGDSWHSKAVNVCYDGLSSIKSQVYLSPKLWYLRITVIEAQDVIVLSGGGGGGTSMMRYPELLVKVQVGNQLLRTRILCGRNLSNPKWNEDLMFVVAEPLDEYVLISMEDRVGGHGREEEVVGRVVLPIGLIERRWDDKTVASRWLNLDSHHHHQGVDSNSNKGGTVSNRFGSRIHIRASLEGGYHVLDEAVMYNSDVRPTAKQLWKSPVGMLEMGILGATGLMPMKQKEEKSTTDAYCVAKYGQKWVRTRTVVDSLSPKWNEQYTWEVYDPCTVITVGVFDNSRVVDKKNTGVRDAWIGKVRIRLSTLDTDRVYTHSYPLLMLHPSGVKKMGELHLAVRFSCANMGNMLHMYAKSLLPKMHYVHPLAIGQLESLRYQAVNVVSSRLVRAEPPLGREVVEYMLDHDSNLWSMRRSKANFFRLMSVISGIVSVVRFVEVLRSWQKPFFSAAFIIIFFFLVIAPELILPGSLFSMAVIGMLRYRNRPRNPPHVDTWISHADNVYPGELDEEFDSFPTSRNVDLVRMRYDRLRSVAGRIQTVVGDMATQGERFQALLSWRDPRATFLFLLLCLVAAIVLYMVPIRVLVAVWGLYTMRPPKLRGRLPTQALSFFRRLPSRADTML